MKNYWLSAGLLFCCATSVNATELSALLKQCAALASTTERIACYDKVANNEQKQDSQVSEQVPTPVMPASKQQAYPENQPVSVVDKFGASKLKNQPSDVPEQITLTIASTEQDRYEKWILTMSNGQVWKQIDSNTFSRYRQGDDIEIRKGVLGSFLLKKVNANKSIRVTRVK